MKFGLSEGDFKILMDLVIIPLKRSKVRVYIFGSRVRSTHHPFSDIDLLLDPDIDSPMNSITLATIKESIEESRFPIKVDFVFTNDLAKSYCDSVLREKIEV